MEKLKIAVLAVFIGFCAACADQKPAPSEIAHSNLYAHYTFFDGSRAPLSESYCESDATKATNGLEYVKCRAKLKGFMHYEFHFCPTQPKQACKSVRPE